jgi:hypothetical protein
MRRCPGAALRWRLLIRHIRGVLRRRCPVKWRRRLRIFYSPEQVILRTPENMSSRLLSLNFISAMK